MRTEEDAGVAEGADGAEDGDDSKPRNGLPWDGTDRDYMYEELLGTSHQKVPLHPLHLPLAEQVATNAHRPLNCWVLSVHALSMLRRVAPHWLHSMLTF